MDADKAVTAMFITTQGPPRIYLPVLVRNGH
jgi:hypothetical protein